MKFVLFIVFVIIIRVIELIISKRNEKWLLANGAVEYGRAHYPFIIALHFLFFVSMIAEYCIGPQVSTFSPIFFASFIILMIAKVIVVYPLGKFWTTRIYRIPGSPLVREGIYRYFDHPNYMIVMLEIAIIPLTFNLYFTAILFSILNAGILGIRIKEENKALNES